MERYQYSKTTGERNGAVPSPHQLSPRWCTTPVLKSWYSLFEWCRSSRFTATEEMLSKTSDEIFDGEGTVDDFQPDLEDE